MVARRRQAVFLFLGALFLVVADQLTKVWARGSEGEVLCNDGIALSAPLPYAMTIGASVIILILLSIWLLRHRTHALSERIGLTLVIAGGIGNLIDRIIFGCVTDFVDFFTFWHFNLADTLIAAGIAAILWHMIVVVPAQQRVCERE